MITCIITLYPLVTLKVTFVFQLFCIKGLILLQQFHISPYFHKNTQISYISTYLLQISFLV
jgi:hypothetical protein